MKYLFLLLLAGCSSQQCLKEAELQVAVKMFCEWPANHCAGAEVDVAPACQYCDEYGAQQ